MSPNYVFDIRYFEVSVVRDRQLTALIMAGILSGKGKRIKPSLRLSFYNSVCLIKKKEMSKDVNK